MINHERTEPVSATATLMQMKDVTELFQVFAGALWSVDPSGAPCGIEWEVSTTHIWSVLP